MNHRPLEEFNSNPWTIVPMCSNVIQRTCTHPIWDGVPPRGQCDGCQKQRIWRTTHSFFDLFQKPAGLKCLDIFLIFFGLTGCTLLLVECAKLDIWQTRHVRMFTVFLFVSSVCISAPGANGWRLKYDAKIWGHRKRMRAGIPSGIVMWTSLEHLGLLTRLIFNLFKALGGWVRWGTSTF